MNSGKNMPCGNLVFSGKTTNTINQQRPILFARFPVAYFWVAAANFWFPEGSLL